MKKSTKTILMDLLKNTLSPAEKDAFMEAQNWEVVKSGVRYFDRDLEIEYLVPPDTIQGLIDWLLKQQYAKGEVAGRSNLISTFKVLFSID